LLWSQRKGHLLSLQTRKKERDAARLKEDQEKLQKEKENAEREKKRQKERQEKAIVPAGISPDELKKQFDKKREESAKKAKEASIKPAGQVKNYVAPKIEESRRWGANAESAGEDGYAVEQDYSDYPALNAE